MPKEEDIQLGQIAVANGMLSQECWQECLQIAQAMEKMGVEADIPEILLQKGYLTQDQMEIIFQIQGRKQGIRRKIGGYEILEKIGEGGMGMVYKARQINMDRIVALKILSPAFSKDPTYIQRFFREARAAGKLDHPNIVRGIDVGEADGFYYFSMEYVEGETLKQLLDRVGKLSEQQACRIVLGVGRALQHAHEHGIVHRDIKPENIFISKKGAIKLGDLGLAKPEKDVSLTQAKIAMGSPCFVAPEQVEDAQKVDIRADIYSLGITLYYMVTGVLPYQELPYLDAIAKRMEEGIPPARRFNPHLSDEVVFLIEKMTAEDPAKRFQTPKELVQAVQNFLQGGKLSADRTRILPPEAAETRVMPAAQTQVLRKAEKKVVEKTLEKSFKPTSERIPRGLPTRRKKKKSIPFFVWGLALLLLVLVPLLILQKGIVISKEEEENPSQNGGRKSPTSTVVVKSPSSVSSQKTSKKPTSVSEGSAKPSGELSQIALEELKKAKNDFISFVFSSQSIEAVAEKYEEVREKIQAFREKYPFSKEKEVQQIRKAIQEIYLDRVQKIVGEREKRWRKRLEKAKDWGEVRQVFKEARLFWQEVVGKLPREMEVESPLKRLEAALLEKYSLKLERLIEEGSFEAARQIVRELGKVMENPELSRWHKRIQKREEEVQKKAKRKRFLKKYKLFRKYQQICLYYRDFLVRREYKKASQIIQQKRREGKNPYLDEDFQNCEWAFHVWERVRKKEAKKWEDKRIVLRTNEGKVISGVFLSFPLPDTYEVVNEKERVRLRLQDVDPASLYQVFLKEEKHLYPLIGWMYYWEGKLDRAEDWIKGRNADFGSLKERLKFIRHEEKERRAKTLWSEIQRLRREKKYQTLRLKIGEFRKKFQDTLVYEENKEELELFQNEIDRRR